MNIHIRWLYLMIYLKDNPKATKDDIINYINQLKQGRR